MSKLTLIQGALLATTREILRLRNEGALRRREVLIEYIERSPDDETGRYGVERSARWEASRLPNALLHIDTIDESPLTTGRNRCPLRGKERAR